MLSFLRIDCCSGAGWSGIRRLLVIAALPLVAHFLMQSPAEPIFDGDSNRHVATSVFFRDLLTDMPLSNPKTYAEQYYEQYPALGLLVWPPLFHGVCGLLMLFFGTSTVVARCLIAATFVSSAFSVYRLARRSSDSDTASAVTILFGLFPTVFAYSRDVMLEVPTVCLCLLSIEFFTHWLDQNRARSLYFAAAFAAFAALTRFDAVLLIPFYACMLTFHGAWKQLRTRHVAFASLLAILILLPVYAVIVREAGKLHLRQATESVGGSVDGTANGFLASKNLTFYPMALPEQCGNLIAIMCPIGILFALWRSDRKRHSVFFSLTIATYLTFTPLAELRSRHAIYWLPAVAWFAIVAIREMTALVQSRFGSGLSRALPLTAYCLAFAITARTALAQPSWRVEGYADAASYVVEHTNQGDKVFFDGWWDGNFTYHVRHLDPTRSRHVVRGDRLLYDFVCVPSTDFQQHVQTDHEILSALIDAGPKFVVIENPQFFQKIEIAEQLRALITAKPELFVPVKNIPVRTSLDFFPAFELQIYSFQPDAAQKILQSSQSEGTSE